MKHCPKCVNILFHFILLTAQLSPFYRWGHWGADKLSNFPRIWPESVLTAAERGTPRTKVGRPQDLKLSALSPASCGTWRTVSFLCTCFHSQNVEIPVPAFFRLCEPSCPAVSLRPHQVEPTRLLCPWWFSRQEYCSGLSCPPPRDLHNPGIEPRSPALRADFLRSEQPREPKNRGVDSLSLIRSIFWTQ